MTGAPNNTPADVDCVVIGAGVVGLAVARALALRGQDVMVLEAACAIGTGTSSRNSEVIHAGLYYPVGSLKARLCVQGNAMLYDYCLERSIGHRRCGKLIVATDASQLPKLDAIAAHAAGNGVNTLIHLSADEAQALEPELMCVGALWSPATGILDSHAFMLSLQADLEAAGGVVVLNCTVAQVNKGLGAITVVANDGTELIARTVVNAAGLSAPALAQGMGGLDRVHVPACYYAKGNYFSLQGRSPFNRLVYPVPEAAGLGVHATIDLAGQVKFGPDVEWVGSSDDLAVDPGRGAAFYAEVRRYWPGLKDGTLQPSYAGIRPKLAGPGMPSSDFVIQGHDVHGICGLVNLFGIESPGLTAALAIGEEVQRRLT